MKIWEPVITGSFFVIVCVCVRIRSGTAYVVTQGTMISPSCAQPSEKEIFDFVFEHGKGNAIYKVFVIYNPTNNAVLIKYRNHKPFPIYKHIFALSVSQNVTAHAQSTSTTHFSYSSKCRRTSLYKTYHRVFDFVKSKGTG